VTVLFALADELFGYLIKTGIVGCQRTLELRQNGIPYRLARPNRLSGEFTQRA